MTDLLKSVKADLLDRRLLPFVALVGVALAVALGYAVLGGGSTAATPPAAISSPPATTGVSGIAVSQAPSSASQAVAETTSGSAKQRGGSSRDPFAPLPGSAAKSASTTAGASTTASKAAGAGTTTTSPASSTPKGATETTPAATPKPSTPAKPETVYHVAVGFGVVPAGTPPASVNLTQYANLKRFAPLPSAKQPLIVFRGVNAGGKSATFTLVGEAILRGTAKCLPSTSQCQVIELKTGQIEEFEYLPPAGPVVLYELQLVGITSSKASVSVARNAFRGESKAGRELLRRIGLVALPGLRYAPAKGVLVATPRRAFGAHAHVALAPRHR